jgi:glutamyl-tRNA reductase
MQNQFKSISLSYKSAPLAVREQVALNEDEIKNFSLRIRDMFDIQEAILVSTCNRTEVYYVSEENRNTDIIKLLLLDKGIATTDEYFAYFQQYNAQADAVQHLFEVATGYTHK